MATSIMAYHAQGNMREPTCMAYNNPHKDVRGDTMYVGFTTATTAPEDGSVRYFSNGTTRVDWNRSNKLRLPQKREWNGPDVFDSGCTTLYCSNDVMCPSTKRLDPHKPVSSGLWPINPNPKFSKCQAMCMNPNARS